MKKINSEALAQSAIFLVAAAFGAASALADSNREARYVGTYSLAKSLAGFCPSGITITAEPPHGLGVYCTTSRECITEAIAADGSVTTVFDTIVYQFSSINLGAQQTLQRNAMTGIPNGWRTVDESATENQLNGSTTFRTLAGRPLISSFFAATLEGDQLAYLLTEKSASDETPRSTGRCVYERNR
ncbi:MAG: hypothetical protein NDJ90_00900 [Oligoflexia bacterium]|nr:hypothetical protein [Oligoflexia bacterium]